MSAVIFKNPVEAVSDVVRGTILVDRPEQVSPVLQAISDRVRAVGGRCETKNFWGDLQPLSLGYVGIHRRCWVPLPLEAVGEAKTEMSFAPKKRYIRVEVQVHFRAIMNEAEEEGCPKHFAHLLYKKPKEAGEDQISSKISSSSQLIYLTAMTRLLAPRGALESEDDTLQQFQAMTGTKADRKMRLQMATRLFLHDQKLGLAKWDENLQVVVPENVGAIAAAWKDTATRINRLIDLPAENEDGFKECVNTATTVSELYADAKKIAPFFQNLCQEAANSQQGCSANFGPKNECMIKTADSLLEKIRADYELELGPFMRRLLPRIDRSWDQVTGNNLLPFECVSLLQNLDFSNCDELTDGDLSFLPLLSKLKSLNLANCAKLTDAGLVNLRNLTRLTSLNLSGCRITDEGLSSLWRLTKLKSLNVLRCAGITDAGLARSGLQCLHRNYPMHPEAAEPQQLALGPQVEAPTRVGWITRVEQLQRLNEMFLVTEFGPAVTNWYTALLRLPTLISPAIPPLPRDIAAILRSPCPVYGDQVKPDGTPHKVGDTHVLSLISEEFRTITHLEESIVKPYEAATYRVETPLRSRVFWSAARKEYGEQPFPPTYWVLTIRGILPNSHQKDWGQQVDLLQNLSTKASAEYEMLTLQESYATFVTHYVATGGENLYSTPNRDNKGHTVYTYVKEPTGAHRMIIGGAEPTGIRIARRFGYSGEILGVMASRRL